MQDGYWRWREAACLVFCDTRRGCDEARGLWVLGAVSDDHVQEGFGPHAGVSALGTGELFL
jgi:hypothetical protein